MKLGVKIGKLKLPTPIVCASGTFGYGTELGGLVNQKNIGAITTKTITLIPRAGNPPPRIYESDLGVINSVGLENPGLDGFLKDIAPALARLKTKIIVSVGGFSVREYKEIVKRLGNRQFVAAIELNLSCPNLQLKQIVSQNRKATYGVVKAVRRLTKKTLIVKVTPEVSDIVSIAKAAHDSGADAIALVNTFYALRINIETKKSYLGSIYGGYSGKAIKPLSLYRTWLLYRKLNIPLIAGGGIENARDAIEFILAGASAVSLGTVNLVYPNSAQRITQGIKEYMKRKRIADISKLRGNFHG